jgi:hypothetical protein
LTGLKKRTFCKGYTDWALEMGVSEAHVEKWVSLQSPAITGAPTPEQQAALGKLAADKKAWLKALATELGTVSREQPLQSHCLGFPCLGLAWLGLAAQPLALL